MSLQDNIIRHLYRGFSTVVSLQSSLLASLKSEFILVFLLASLGSRFIQSSLLVSLWNIFLRRLYGDISTVTHISSKLEICLQRIRESTIYSIQTKPEISTFWLLLHESIQTSVLHFYKNIGYYVIDQTINNTTWDIRKQTLGYIIFVKGNKV